MFIRTRSRRLKNGKQYRGYALLESRRIDGISRHVTLLNLGQNFNIPKAQWGELTGHVEARLKGEKCLPFQEDEAFHNAVDDIVKRLHEAGYDIHKKANQRHLINLDEITHPNSRTVAGERLVLQALKLSRLDELLQDLGFPASHIKLACALIVGRALCPGSERHTHDWMINQSSILELLNLDPPSLNTLYRCSDRLNAHRKQITNRLFGNTKELLNFDEAIIFYDLTNTFYHGQEKGELLRYGRSKQKRNDCPLVTLAMTLDASGFPRNVEILPGNASEPGTLKQAIEQLNGDRPTVIMDAGIATKENLAYLKEQGLDWIVVERSKAPPVPEGEPDEQFETAGGVKIKAWKIIEADGEAEEEGEVEEEGEIEAEGGVEEAGEVEEEGEVEAEGGVEEAGEVEAEGCVEEEGEVEAEELRIYVHSEAKQATEDQILETKCEKFLEALTKLHAGLSKPGYLKNYHKVLVKVGRLREKFKQVSHLYEVTVTPKKGTKFAASVTVTRLASHTRRTLASGGYVLRTSHTGWSVETIARTYWRLTEIESTFRVMKSDLGAPGQLAKCSGWKSRNMKLKPSTYFHEPCVYSRERIHEASVVVRTCARLTGNSVAGASPAI